MSPAENPTPSATPQPRPEVEGPEASPQRVNPLEDPRWDERLAAFSSASFFHRAAWCRVLHDTYGYAPVYFVVGRKSSPASAALLPLVEVDSWLTGRRGVSLPFTDECEPLSTDPQSYRQVFQAALQYARSRAWKYLELRGAGGVPPDGPASTSFLGHSLDLAGDEPAMLARFDSSVRRAIRKAEQSELTVEISQDLAALKRFYGLLCRTRQRHGLPPQPFAFFENIHRRVLQEGGGRVVLASRRGSAVAGAVYFDFGATVVYKFGASDETFQQFRGNNLVMWEAIKWYARRGFARLDFGRTSLDNDGLRRFKLSWGTKERQIDYARYDLRAEKFVVARDEAAGWYNRIFRLLPLAVSRALGGALYRHVA